MRELKLSGVKLFAWCIPSTPTAFTVYDDARHRGEEGEGEGEKEMCMLFVWVHVCMYTDCKYTEAARRWLVVGIVVCRLDARTKNIGVELARDWHSALMP